MNTEQLPENVKEKDIFTFAKKAVAQLSNTIVVCKTMQKRLDMLLGEEDLLSVNINVNDVNFLDNEFSKHLSDWHDSMFVIISYLNSLKYWDRTSEQYKLLCQKYDSIYDEERMDLLRKIKQSKNISENH